MAILKLVKDKIQKKTSRTKSTTHEHGATEVQKRIKEGHFAVLAMQGGESRKFTVALSFLDDQEFLKLLDRSQEEYGFDQRGIITLLCPPCELEYILSRKPKDEGRTSATKKVLSRQR
ncbi:protein SMALL AUXIN UP-REGULATED RNA 54-like [Nymphaea colorata]|uniref:Small auxin-up RNA n=1 Tax=Nymphaea colorata TaxID=210225 RepID=A0A5K0YEI4_9MAGN|nr:protein SMALL AUXIN UP-REGULATED RNA 54-like [Nymphaea colorata]VVV76336.1 unnamed protein product [Nymphaea colorata]